VADPSPRVGHPQGGHPQPEATPNQPQGVAIWPATPSQTVVLVTPKAIKKRRKKKKHYYIIFIFIFLKK
jgi:hypothetical protein